MKRRRYAVVISDDIPADYLRLLLGNRVDRNTIIFSRTDAVRGADATRNGLARPKQRHANEPAARRPTIGDQK